MYQNITYVEAQPSPKATWNNTSLESDPSEWLRALPPGHQSRNSPKHNKQIIDPTAITQSMTRLKVGRAAGRKLTTVARRSTTDQQKVVTN
jgi:hypothetical protein